MTFPSISSEEVNLLLKTQSKARIITSFFPIDHWSCECQKIIVDIKNQLSQMSVERQNAFKRSIGIVRCPKNKSHLNLYEIICNNCHLKVAECYAADASLKDMCDFHYVCMSQIDMKKEESINTVYGYWTGALAINVSPIDGILGIECACGNDTRDFRANQSLSDNEKMERFNKIKDSRYFNQKESAFTAILNK